MKMKCIWIVAFFLLVFGNHGAVMAAAITDFDSTQPRGFEHGTCVRGWPVLNDQGLDLCSVDEGFHAPQRVGDGSIYRDWSGNMMGNATRDPSFFATLSVANKDFINFLYAAAAEGLDTSNPDLYSLVGLNTAREVVCALKLYNPDFGIPCVPGGEIQLLDEDKLPVTADICLRCHSPVGWMEGSSEPETPHFPFLKGQFWGAAFRENPVDENGNPRSVNISVESEAEMEGIQCDFCHRTKHNRTLQRESRFDGSLMSAGGGSFFADQHDSTRDRHHLRYETIIPESTVAFSGNPGERYDCWACHKWVCSSRACDIKAYRDDCTYCHMQDTGQSSGVQPLDVSDEERHFCGSCHDVTNPIIYTRTPGADRMLHPIERTYTEWYWSDYRDEKKCQDCHRPMTFEGAQTWLLYPGLNELWGDVDRKWTIPPFNYPVSASREQAYMDAMQRNRQFMQQDTADIDIINTPDSISAGQEITIQVKVTNKTGHKLPTGFAEGRQMWIHLRAVDDGGTVIFESGYLFPDGSLARKEYRVNGITVPDPGKTMIKIYEQLVLAEGYKNFKLDGYSILDADRDGTVTHKEEEFHFVLMNYIEKDNRIPPKGFNKDAYMKDGAFIIPHDPKDTDYPSGQNWDITPYTFTVPSSVSGNIHVTAILKYQTFNKEYMEFLNETDTEKTEAYGGRARDLPAGPYGNLMTWGSVTYQMWQDNDKGKPVTMVTATKDISVQ